MKGRSCLKIVLDVWLHPGNHNTYEASYQKQPFRYDRKFVFKKEVDIINRNKWWINKELQQWSFDKP